MRLQPGDKAKDFSVKDISENPVAIRDYQGKKLLLSFPGRRQGE